MWRSFLCCVLVVGDATLGPFTNDPAGQQILIFKEEHPEPIGIMTTSAGAPIELQDATNTLNSNLIYNEYFVDTLTHLNRERIPERVVHAKGGGAFGYFEVTHDLSDIFKSKVFSRVGRKTPVVVRFSPVVTERGGSDTTRDARGFAIRFYTEEGNLDIVGLSTPMFSIKDPLFFPTFVRAQKRNPATNLMDGNMLWDFLTLRPESLHMFMLLFTDWGTPDGFRHMPGFGIHTFEVVNKYGDKHFVRFHFIPQAGIKTLNAKEAAKISSYDADYAIRDLYRSIGNGDFPSWTVSIQVLSLGDVKKANFDVFDVTKILPQEDYPLRPLGRFILNKNPTNYFAEIEQLAFNPANLIPGFLGAPDKLFEARRFAYRDTQNYRLGVNFNKIPVNCPIQSKVFTYNRDGRAPVRDNGKNSPNYFPNSYNGPIPYVDKNRAKVIKIVQDDPNNTEQAAELYANEMTKEERTSLIENVLTSLGGVAELLQERAVDLFMNIHPDLGSRIARGLRANVTAKFNG